MGQFQIPNPIEFFGVKVWYERDMVVHETINHEVITYEGVKIAKTEPPLEGMPTTKLLKLLRKMNDKLFVFESVVHGYDIITAKLRREVEKEIRRRVGKRFLEKLERLCDLAISTKNPEEVREAVREAIKEFGKIPKTYLPMFSHDIKIALENIRRDADYRRKIGMRCLDNQVERVIKEMEEFPRIADDTLVSFLENLNHEVHQETYNDLEIADILEHFCNIMRIMEKGEITVRIKVTPEVAEKMLAGDFSEIHRQVEEKIRKVMGA